MAEGAVEKSPWNSLEFVKIVAAAATPLAVFLLGVQVNRSAEQGRSAREEQARLELRAEKERAGKAEIKARADAKAAADAAAQLAHERERALRQEGFDREALLRHESDTREALLRREAAREARSNRVVDRRIEAWSRVAPTLHQAMRALAEIQGSLLTTSLDEYPREEIERSSVAMTEGVFEFAVTIQAYDAYYSRDTIDKKDDLVEALAAAGLEANRLLVTRESLARSLEIVQERYRAFMAALRRDLRS